MQDTDRRRPKRKPADPTRVQRVGSRVPRLAASVLALRITFSGLLCVGIVVLVGLAALNSEANLLFLLFGISLGILAYSAAAPVFMVRQLEIERVAPAAVVAGRPFNFEYIARTRRRWLCSWSLVIGEVLVGRRPVRFPVALIEVLRPGRTERVALTGVCPERGRLLLQGVRVISRFPFGLFACSVDLPVPAELTVYPAVGRFRRDPWRDRRLSDTPSQRNAKRQARELDEFYGVREYRPGDNLRWIHWRRSAHAGHLVVRESTPARTQQVTVIVDPWPEAEAVKQAQPASTRRDVRPAGSGDSNGDGEIVPATGGRVARSRWSSALAWLRLAAWSRGRAANEELSAGAVEELISVAATAVCEAIERGHRVGLVARAAIPVVIAPSGGRSHRQRLLHELALLRPGAKEGLDRLISRVRWTGGWQGRCLVCATRHNRSVAEVVRFLAGHLEAALAITPDTEGFEGLFEPAPEAYVDLELSAERTAAGGRRAG